MCDGCCGLAGDACAPYDYVWRPELDEGAAYTFRTEDAELDELVEIVDDVCLGVADELCTCGRADVPSQHCPCGVIEAWNERMPDHPCTPDIMQYTDYDAGYPRDSMRPIVVQVLGSTPHHVTYRLRSTEPAYVDRVLSDFKALLYKRCIHRYQTRYRIALGASGNPEGPFDAVYVASGDGSVPERAVVVPPHALGEFIGIKGANISRVVARTGLKIKARPIPGNVHGLYVVVLPSHSPVTADHASAIELAALNASLAEWSDPAEPDFGPDDLDL